MQPLWLTPKQAADSLGITVHKLHQYRRKGLIKGWVITARTIRYHRDEVARSKAKRIGGVDAQN